MAFDFLGTFSLRTWITFKDFFNTVKSTTLMSSQYSTIDYDFAKNNFSQAHLPGIRDHQVAEAARLAKYYNRLDFFYSLKTLSSVEGGRNIGYSLEPGTSFPYPNVPGTTSYEGFTPTAQSADYNIADAVLYLKTKVKRQIKAMFERDEYRMKHCYDSIDQILDEHKDWDLLETPGSTLFNAQLVMGTIDNEFKNPTLDSPLLDGSLEQTASNQANNFDGEASLRADNTHRIVYRGVLLKKSKLNEPVIDNSDSAQLLKLFGIQNFDPPV